ncbi:MAG: DUF4870 domain-containing protein [Opitutales bacterium]|jgi:uncharacterized Tic20 family protein
MQTPTNDKLWNVLCHLSPLLGLGLIGPLVVYLVSKSDAESTIPLHARETLNFHISLLIYGVIGVILVAVGIGLIILSAVAIAGVVLAVVGAVKASNGVVYRYPATIRLVK